jgi:hypothetical protein
LQWGIAPGCSGPENARISAERQPAIAAFAFSIRSRALTFECGLLLILTVLWLWVQCACAIGQFSPSICETAIDEIAHGQSPFAAALFAFTGGAPIIRARKSNATMRSSRSSRFRFPIVRFAQVVKDKSMKLANCAFAFSH